MIFSDDINKIQKVHKYTSIVSDGILVFENGDFSRNGKFHRYAGYGQFEDLVELLEHLNLMDNKIAIEYSNGLVVGYYDNKWYVGTEIYHPYPETVVVEHDEILRRYEEYCNRKKLRRNR